MSIILDALRKAEAGRRQPDQVGLTGAPLTRVPLRARIPKWLPVAGIAVLLSVGAGAYVLWPSGPARDGIADQQAAAPATSLPPAAAPLAPATTAAPTGVTAAATEDSTPDQPPDVRPLSLEARGTTATAAPEPKVQRGSVEVRDLSSDHATGGSKIKPGSVEVRDLLAEQGAPPVPPEGASPLPAAQAGADRSNATTARAPDAAPAPATLSPSTSAPTPAPAPSVPSVDDLVASGQLEPPGLSLDMHAYGADPAARFVYINMRRYHNGDTTREGAVVEDITPDGVVLRLHGLRFLLQSR